MNSLQITIILAMWLVIFVIAKLSGAITWGWWAVLSPLWIGVAFCFLSKVIGYALARSQDYEP